MAVIGKIRKHSGLIVITVGIALAAFVLGDFFKSGPSRGSNKIGEIEGEDINIVEFNRMVEANIAKEKEQQNKEQLSPAESFNIRQRTWEEFLYNQLMGEQFDELGVEVTSDELFELIQGTNLHPAIIRDFTDLETGEFRRQQIIEIIQNLNRLQPAQRNWWLNLEKDIKKDQLQKKYNNLIFKSYYVPDRFAQKLYREEEQEAVIRFIDSKYRLLPDTVVSFTNAEVEAKYKETKHSYEQPEFVSLEYVVFEVTPSPEDYEKAKNTAEQLFETFQKKDNEEIPIFVKGYSDDEYDSTWYVEGELPATIDSMMFNSPVGTFVPPYLEEGAYHTAKLMDIAYRPDTIKASRILIKYDETLFADENQTRTKEQAEALTDSLMNILESNPSRMEELAREYSDEQSASNGGDIGWFNQEVRLKELKKALDRSKNLDNQPQVKDIIIKTEYDFGESVINSGEDDINKLDTPFGYYIIKTTGQSPNIKKVRVAMINREVQFSDKTNNEIKRRAKLFAGKNKTPEKFEQAIIDSGYVKKTAPHVTRMTNQIPGLSYPRKIIQWAYDEEIDPGTVSHVFQIDHHYVVVLLKERREKGYIPLKELRSSIENLVIQDKKADYLAEKMNNLEGNIYQMAEDLNVKVDTVTVSFGSVNIKGIGREPKVISAVFISEEGVLSPPVKGNLGVYRFVVDQFLEPSGSTNLAAYKQPLYNSFQRRMSGNAYYTAIKEKADIVDNRIEFY